MVRKRHVGIERLRDVADGLYVRRDVAIELLVGELVERLHLEPLVAVVDIHGQEPMDVRPVDGATAPVSTLCDNAYHELALLPVADGVDETEPSRIVLLAEKVDLVTHPDECLGQLRVVDVRAGTPQEIAVEHEDAHGGRVYPPARRC
jgi:hypothetical protein